jgi:uncharacterized protein YndB with AHSA1/START domain
MSDFQSLHISRTFAAPRQAVWDAWTKPEELKQWFMPAPFSVPNCELDVRPGGQIKIDTQGPDGAIMPLVGEFKVVEEPSKLVMTNVPLDTEGNELFEVQHTVELSEDGDQTVLTVTAEVLSARADAKPFLDGMEAGLNQALDQMGELISGRA